MARRHDSDADGPAEVLAAKAQLRDTAAWQRAGTLKCNPDAAQWPVRQRALQDGKLVYMAVPRLAAAEPFFLLDPADLADSPRQASSITGATRSARIRWEELTDEKVAAIPLLGQLRNRRSASG